MKKILYQLYQIQSESLYYLVHHTLSNKFKDCDKRLKANILSTFLPLLSFDASEMISPQSDVLYVLLNEIVVSHLTLISGESIHLNR